MSCAGSQADSKVTNLSKRPKSSANSTTSSCISAARARAAAKKAVLEAQAASFKRRQALQEEQLRLQQLSEELELQTELAKANAEEHTYLEVEREEKTTSIFKNIEENARPSWPNDIPQYTPVDGQYYTQHDASFQPQAIAGADDFPHALRKSIHEREQPKSIQQNTPALQMPSKDRKPNRIYGSAPTSTAGASTEPRGVANQMEKLLLQQQRHTLALMLPQPEIPTFSGDPIEFQNFIRAFENPSSILKTTVQDCTT